jgi:hypothetical protein
VFDAKALPSGNLLVISAYQLQEITLDGVLVRTINPSIGLGDARGVAYNPATDKIYVSMLGYTGEFSQVMRLDGVTGLVDMQVTYGYPDDLFLTNDGRLLVGSTYQAPAFFDLNLTQTGNLGSGSQSFVTQAIPVPEPGSVILASFAAIVGFGSGRFARTRRACHTRRFGWTWAVKTCQR